MTESKRQLAEQILQKLLRVDSAHGVDYVDGLNWLFEDLERAGFFSDPEWEYGYHATNTYGESIGYWGTKRVPSENWLSTMGKPYRRRSVPQIEAGEWEECPDPVILEIDAYPWLRPGGDPEAQPLENRSKFKREGWSFAPRRGYEKDIERYNPSDSPAEIS